MATISAPATAPSPGEDCEQLHKAFSGWGTNEGLIISILAHRTAAQRRVIRDVYSQTYGEDLLKSLDKELTRDFEIGRSIILRDQQRAYPEEILFRFVLVPGTPYPLHIHCDQPDPV